MPRGIPHSLDIVGINGWIGAFLENGDTVLGPFSSLKKVLVEVSSTSDRWGYGGHLSLTAKTEMYHHAYYLMAVVVMGCGDRGKEVKVFAFLSSANFCQFIKW